MPEPTNKELQELVKHYKELADSKLNNIHELLDNQKEIIRESLENSAKNNELNHSLLMRIYGEQKKTNSRVTKLEIKTNEMEQETAKLERSTDSQITALKQTTTWARWLQRHPVIMLFVFVTAVWVGDLIPADVIEKIINLGSKLIKVFI
jgi:hypothetical protein